MFHRDKKPWSELMVIWKGWFETVPCRAPLNTPFPALCPRILGTRFTNYGLRMFWGELMVIWKGWSETAPCRAALNAPFSALSPRILGTRFTNYGLRVSGKSPETRKSEKKITNKYKIPCPRSGPKNTKKYPPKIKKTKMAQNWPFSYVFDIFSYFWGRTLDGGFL